MDGGNVHIDHDQETLRKIVEGTAAETGEKFFDALVKNLADALGTKYAWVTEWLESENRLRSLSFWADDDYYGDYEYDIAGTPCEPVIENRDWVHIPDRVMDLFPDDSDLRPLEPVSYIGVPLFDTDGRILGHLAILHTEPLPETPRILAIFRIFAERAAAEMRRLRRERDLEEREEKLSSLVDGVMDAIIEVTEDLVITHVNRAAEKILQTAAAELIGHSLGEYLLPAASGRLVYMIRELARYTEGHHAVWLPETLDAKRRDGTTLVAEASLSRYELRGQPFYALILRDIADRLEANERIQSLSEKADYLQREIDELHGFDEILGESRALRQVLAEVEQVAIGDTAVFITGETGTGKELIARAIHERSARAQKSLVKVNCAAIASNLQESEFFGHEKGAFTGATEKRPGRFKLADEGTIFLDEVGELPLDLQAKLLRVLQEGEYEPVGGSRTEKVDVRVIAATNRDLQEMVAKGTFRQDLFYRLNVFPIRVPPLRERDNDVVLIASILSESIARRLGRPKPVITDACKAKLRRYDWPGNVRELQNVIERAIITSSEVQHLNLDRALPDMTQANAAASRSSTFSAPDYDHVFSDTEMRDFERENIIRALELSDWKISGTGGAAELLDTHPNTLTSRIKKLGITRG